VETSAFVVSSIEKLFPLAISKLFEGKSSGPSSTPQSGQVKIDGNSSSKKEGCC
jgi:hypothetical protein